MSFLLHLAWPTVFILFRVICSLATSLGTTRTAWNMWPTMPGRETLDQLTVLMDVG